MISLEGTKGLEAPWRIKTEIKAEPVNSSESEESNTPSPSMFYETRYQNSVLEQQLIDATSSLVVPPTTESTNMTAFAIAHYIHCQQMYQYQNAVAQYNSQNYSNTMNSSSFATPQMSDFKQYQQPIYPTPNNSEISIVSDTSRLTETPTTSRTPVLCGTPTSQYDAANSPRMGFTQPENGHVLNLTPSRSMTSTPISPDSLQTESKALEESEASSLCGSDDSSNEDKLDQNHNDNHDYNKPAFNSHGKEKVYKCKFCNMSFNIKHEFWDHARVHIKKEKQLECAKCPFVTGFKHHLEYHIRSKHSKVKPFKCNKCDYRCVNKSMLMSHFKSHSTIYQFRCMDCNFVAKYLHSMKQHLQRKNHRPAMVLNEDGTPNPLPIIDVFGRKRGPKPKKIPKEIIMIQTSTPKLNIPLPTLSTSLQGVRQPFAMANFGAELPALGKNFPTPVKQTNDNTKADESNTDLPNEILDLSVKENKDNIMPITIPQMTPLATEPKRNRRKGKAVRIPQEEPQFMDLVLDDERLAEPEDIETDRFTQSTKAISMEVQESSSKPDSVCDHCQISFKDEVLYELHMEYHSNEDPLTCKICGESYKTVRTFNVHLARNQH